MNRFFRTFAWVTCVACLACVSCGEASTDAEPSKVLQFGRNSPAVWLFAVDDVGDPRGAELRERLWTNLVQHLSDSGLGGCGDPAQYVAIDRRAVVMLPSGAGLVSPDTDAALALTTTHDTIEARTAWIDAVRRVVDERLVAPGTLPYAFISRLSDTVSLLTGMRAAATEGEQRALQSLAGTSELVLVSATGHEDESSGSPEMFAIQLRASAGHFSYSSREALMFPSTDGLSCDRARVTTERYSRWLAASSTPLLELPEFWRPGDECRLAADVPVTCSNPCLEERPHFSPEGRADCHVYVASDPKEGCPESRGLMPSNASVVDANGPVCEMRQLEGAALESCRHDLSCADCEPGYCFSAIESLVAGCEMSGKVASPRFVNGAANVPSRKVYIYCDE